MLKQLYQFYKDNTGATWPSREMIFSDAAKKLGTTSSKIIELHRQLVMSGSVMMKHDLQNQKYVRCYGERYDN